MSAELEKQRRLTAEENMVIVMKLASGKFKQKEIAVQHDLSEQRISQIKQENEELFDRVRNARLDNITAELIKDQEWRFTQYARDLEKMDSVWHPEYVKARTQILKNVAEETGEIAPKTQITIRPVEHSIVGIDIESDL